MCILWDVLFFGPCVDFLLYQLFLYGLWILFCIVCSGLGLEVFLSVVPLGPVCPVCMCVSIYVCVWVCVFEVWFWVVFVPCFCVLCSVRGSLRLFFEGVFRAGFLLCVGGASFFFDRSGF